MNTVWITVVLVCALCTCNALELEIEYFKTAVIPCDDDRFNLSDPASTQPTKRFWILPSGDVTNASMSDRVSIEQTNFTLTIHKIDDPDFGWYHCILVWSDHSVSDIRQGVNVDGAYYGDLLSKYQHNAMIGGIAAASLFVVLTGSCLVWHMRYHKRNAKNKAVDDLDKAIGGFDTKAYDNVGLELEKLPGEGAANGVNVDERDVKF